MRWLPILRLRLLAWQGEPLAALISLQTLENALNVLGYPAVTLFIMIESTGIPFPGETMLLLASFYAAVDHHLQIPIVIACAATGAIVGDNLGYLVGRTGGRAFVERFGRFLFLKPKYIERAEQFFARHGNKAVFFGRFIAILRTWSAFLAGLNHMHWQTFLVFNAAGGIVWAIIYGLIGFFAGRIFHDNFGQVEQLAGKLSWGAVVILAVAFGVVLIILLRRRRKAQSSKNVDEGKNDPISESVESSKIDSSLTDRQ